MSDHYVYHDFEYDEDGAIRDHWFVMCGGLIKEECESEQEAWQRCHALDAGNES